MTAVAALALVAVLGVSVMLANAPAGPPAATASALQSALPTTSPGSAAATISPAPTTTAPTSPSPPPTNPEPTPIATGTPVPTPTQPVNAAPTSAAEFDLRAQVIEIGFPLLPETRYRYRNNWLDLRDDPPNDYNHAGLRRDGEVVRLHDGIDIYAAEGEPLVAPFGGTVIDPATRWQPWDPSRYGTAVIIESDEPTSEGYVALFAHLDRAWVELGQRVTRGQVIGTIGRSGNAEGQSVHTHLHFELRAPFALDWSEIGEDRLVDAFNPFPSLVSADPKRNR